MDWQTLIANLMTAERSPENVWKSQQSSNSSKISTLSTINNDLTAFQTATKALTSSVFGTRSATVSDTTVGSASADTGAANAQYNFQVNTLATTSTLVGTSNVGAPISSSSNVSGVTISTMNLTTTPTPGTFTVNGKQITVTANESLQDVFDAIATATSNAVTAHYNPASGSSGDTVTLTSSSPIILGSASDTSNLLSALKLFSNGSSSVSSGSALGIVNKNSTIANSNLATAITNVDSSGNGTFSINGTSINVNINTDTIQGLMTRINNSAAGVTIKYDVTNDQFSLTNNLTGSLGISVNETGNGVLAAMGLSNSSTFKSGVDAKVQVNGGPVLTSNSNTFNETTTGIKGLSFTASSTGSTDVTVASDTSNASTLLNTFISSYNVLQSFIGSQSSSTTDANGKVTAGLLAGDHDVSGLVSDVQNLVFNPISGTSNSSINSLDSIGIGFSSMANVLTITDQTKLTNALQNNPDAVSSLFNNANGLIAQLNTFVTNATASTGLFTTEPANLNTLNNNLQGQINALETQVNNANTQMTKEYQAMETALSNLQTESSTLTSYFGTSSSSSSSTSTSKAS